ncbi:uncharacterized protein [Nicotiana tomentosiformis]|uniref:uncharacterized protein n=1 Tax=Nicotiana tomentosiformis TaxID=4098 RepID=UPI00388CC3B0
MLVSEYAIRFSELSRYAPTLVSTVRERVRRFIEGLNYGVTFSMTQELETDTPYQQVVEIARRLKGMQGREREDREAKRPQGTRGFSGGNAAATARDGRAYALPISQGPQGSQAMVVAPVAAPPAPPARYGGQACRGLLREGVQAHFYTFSGMTEAIASNAVITCIVPGCHRDASVLFYPGSTYSYVSSYFAQYLDISHDSLIALVYVSTPVGDSIIVDCVYQSCLVTIGGYEIRVYLLLLNMVDFDMILGMDWFVSLSCYFGLSCQDRDIGYAKVFAVGEEGYIGLYS